MISSEMMNVIVAVVLGLHIAVEIIHYVFGFIDNRRTKRILNDVKTLLEKQPPCVKELKEINEKLDSFIDKK